MATAIGTYATAALLKLRTGIPDSTDDTELGKICDQVNAYIESPAACGRVMAPIASATYTFNGNGTPVLRVRNGIRAVSLLELAHYTGAAYETIAAEDYFLEPVDRPNGWPATSLELSDVPVGAFRVFPRGKRTVRVTATTGWGAIPDEIIEVALVAATKAWHAVESGQSDLIGTDDMGRPLISRFFSGRDLGTLRAYSVNLPG